MRSRLLATATQSLPLVRDFIHESLYHPVTGYFSRHASPVGRVDPPIDFGALPGREAYQRKLHELYHQQKVSWITPSELFTPAYGAAVGGFILQRHTAIAPGQPLRIVEVGGGNGTLAKDILNHVQSTAPEAYRTCGYATIEISAALAERQRQRAAASGHADRFSVRLGSALNADTWGGRDTTMTHVLLCEVLDNLPHDRVVRYDDAWLQTHVDTSAMAEVLAPATDPLIADTLAALGPRLLRQVQGSGFSSPMRRLVAAALGRSSGDTAAAFVPTGALRFLRALHTARPNHCLLAADFDFLPEVAVPGANAPLVSAVREGASHDSPTYLVAPGTADIFFPTDFSALQQLHTAAAPPGAACDSNVLKSAEFFSRHGDLRRTSLAGSAYNPLRDDFSNTSVLVASSRAAAG